MHRDKMIGAKDVRAFKTAQWEGFRELAAKLPNHHVLAVELVRTFNDETAAVFTVVRNREPVRYVVIGDAQGRVKPHHECAPRAQAMAFSTMSADASLEAVGDPGDATPDYAMGHPPVEQPSPPGITALASALLAGAFNAGEHIDPDR